MLLDVTKVSVLENYMLDLVFENGEHRLFDFKPLLKEKPFVKIQKVSIFKQAHIQHGTVVWPNEIDISPEYLYENSIPLA